MYLGTHLWRIPWHTPGAYPGAYPHHTECMFEQSIAPKAVLQDLAQNYGCAYADAYRGSYLDVDGGNLWQLMDKMKTKVAHGFTSAGVTLAVFTVLDYCTTGGVGTTLGGWFTPIVLTSSIPGALFGEDI